MRLFLTRVLKTGVVLLLFMAVSAVINEVLFRLDRYAVPQGTKVLVIGDSRPMYGLRPDVIESSVSICQYAEPYLFTFYKLRGVLEANPDIETVVLGFGAHNIGGKNDVRLNDDMFAALMFRRYDPVMRWQEWSQISLSSRAWFLALVSKYLVPNPHYLANLLPRWVTNGTRHYPYVGGFIERSESNLESRVLEMIVDKYYDGPTAEEISAVSVEYLERIVELTAQKGVRLVLISMPVHPEYYERIPASIMEAFTDVSARYRTDPRVDVIDVSDLALPDEHYLDFDHVSGAGSTVVSEVVNRRLRSRSQ